MGNLDHNSKLLKSYLFEIHTQLKNRLIWRICQKFAINGCNGECECKVCFKCLENSINEGNILCLRGNSDFNSVKMIANVNSVDDNHKDEGVVNSLIKFHFKPCEYDSELEETDILIELFIQFLLVYHFAMTTNKSRQFILDRFIGGICNNKLIINELMFLMPSESQDFLKEYLLNQQINPCQIQPFNFHKIVLDLKVLQNEVHELSRGIPEIINETARIVCQLKEELEKTIVDLENINNELIAENKDLKKENIRLKKEMEYLQPIELSDNVNSETPHVILWNFPMKLFGSFIHCFDNISHLKTRCAVNSDRFLSSDGQHEVILQLWPRGCSHNHQDSHICIELSINCVTDSSLVPLLKCRVKLNFGSQSVINTEKYLTFFDDSTVTSFPQFHFSKSDLKRSDTIEKDSLKVYCEIFID